MERGARVIGQKLFLSGKAKGTRVFFFSITQTEMAHQSKHIVHSQIMSICFQQQFLGRNRSFEFVLAISSGLNGKGSVPLTSAFGLQILSEWKKEDKYR